jgi:hypothetical protein
MKLYKAKITTNFESFFRFNIGKMIYVSAENMHEAIKKIKNHKFKDGMSKEIKDEFFIEKIEYVDTEIVF